jgi:aspartyl-tRNA(Asn)/glutamyl-tRNA(Gln) amidotransferase subunit A
VTSPARLSLKDAAGLLAKGDLSPLELARSVLERVDRINPRLQAYVSVFHDEALQAARQATDEIAARGPRSPLHGIPIAIKDIYDVEGKPTLAGSRVREGHVAEADSEVVRRLRQAGAILVGKTVTHEFATGVTSPPARNPWDLDRIPGGSSGGSGAALAADLCLGATGTDTAGSIRIPASVNGVAGLKPTFGRVSKRGVVPLAWSLDHAGPITKSVTDTALMLGALAGHDSGDASSLDSPVPVFSERISGSLAGLRVGVVSNWQRDRIDAGVGATMQAACRLFQELGASVRETEGPDLELASAIHFNILASEASTYHQPTLRNIPERYRGGTRLFLESGELIPATAYLNAQRGREIVRQGFREAFEDADVLLAPTLPTTAGVFGTNKVLVDGIEEEVTQAYIRLSAPANLAGLPALSVPSGFYGGLPVGIQIIGRPLDEATVLRAGAAYESSAHNDSRRPDL